MSGGGKDFLVSAPWEAWGLRNAPTDKVSQIKDVAHDPRSPKAAKEAQAAAEQFEALLLHQMFQEMWKSVPSEGLLNGGREEQYFRDMLNEGLAGSIAQGQGIGIKEVILKDFQRAKRSYQSSGEGS